MGYRNFINYIIGLGLIYAFIIFALFHLRMLLWSFPVLYYLGACSAATPFALRLAEWYMQDTRKFFLYKTISSKNKAVLITGCDTGIGHLLAIRLNSLGFLVFAGCLKPDGDGAQKLARICPHNLHILPMDVTNNESIAAALHYVEMQLGKHVLWAVVNNAGVSTSGEFDWMPMDELENMHDVNTYGTVRVTRAFLPLLKKSKGRIVNNTSICGIFTMPGYVGYCMSKSAVVAFTTSLRLEMSKWNIKVIDIQAFLYKTLMSEVDNTMEIADRVWSKAPSNIKEEYGLSYLQHYKKYATRMMQRTNPNTHELIDEFVDAIVAEEPLSIYMPCSYFYRVGFTVLRELPSAITEAYMKYHIEGGKPAALKEGYRAASNEGEKTVDKGYHQD